jgi:curli biogenesis system outer membrane secretion channel CsgG
MSGKKSVTTFTLSIVLITLLTTFVPAQQKRRIAVLDFDYSTTTNQEVYMMYGSAVNLSKDMSDLLLNRLQQLGTYELVERQQIAKVMQEQNFGASGRVNDSTAAEFGRLLGVQGLVYGSIKTISFKPPKRSKLFDGLKGKIGSAAGSAVSFPLKDASATVAITFRIINSATGVIVLTGDYVGEASDKKQVINPEGVLGVNSDDKEVAKFLLRGAITDVVSKVALQIEQNPNVLPEPTVAAARQITPPAQPSQVKPAEEATTRSIPAKESESNFAKVIKVAANMITINIGENAGVKVGDNFDVNQVEEVPDPDNPTKPHILTDKIGGLVITKVYPTAAVGKYTGSRPVTMKDRVTPKK